jgi:hypothetical protein
MLQKVDASTAGDETIVPAVSVQGIAICGSHPVTVKTAPFANKDWRIWACSPDNSPYGHAEHAQAIPRADGWFVCHTPAFDKTLPYAYYDWLKNIPVVYMRDLIAMRMRMENGTPLFPTAVPYPDEEMRGRKVIRKDGKIEFTPGKFHRSQFKSSIAFMLALAITECEKQGIPEIALYGILQRGDKHEYQLQRPSTQYFLEEAIRRGIKVKVAPESMLLHDDPEVF